MKKLDDYGLPPKLEDWNLETIVELVNSHEFEPSIFDFKEVLNFTSLKSSEPNLEKEGRKELSQSLVRTVCSMANSEGGFIIFGVRDRKFAHTIPEERIIGIPIKNDLGKQFYDKIKTIQSEIHFEAIRKPILLPGSLQLGIFVVKIPQSPRRPHMVSTEGIFYRRGDGGSADIMQLHEVREQMMNSEERLKKVALLRLEMALFHQQFEGIKANLDNVRNINLRFDTSAFKPVLAEICGLLNISLIENLLNIPMVAHQINHTLDFLSSADFNTREQIEESTLIMVHNLNVLQKLIIKCEQSLAEGFGKLQVDFSFEQELI